MNEARLAIDRAIEKLINRFGTQADVIAELRRALAHMDKKTGSVTESAVETPPTPPIEEEAEPEAEPRPRARMSMGRKK